MLVLEGGDLAGKTTLGAMLAKTYGVEMVHMSAPKDGERDFANVAKVILGNPNNLIVDRMALGDFAYRSFWPREPQTTQQELECWLKYLTLSQSYIVFADPTDETIEQRYNARGDEFLTLDKILIAANNYRGIFESIYESSNFRRVLIYDSGTYSPDGFLQRYESAINEAILTADIPFDLAYDVLHDNEATTTEVSRPTEDDPVAQGVDPAALL